MITSRDYALIGTQQYSAVVIESVYNGEYTQNDVADSSEYFSTREAAQAWALKTLDTFKPLIRTRPDPDDETAHPIDTEYWVEVSHWEWRDISTPGVHDAEPVEIDRQSGYPNPDNDDAVEWEEPEKL